MSQLVAGNISLCSIRQCFFDFVAGVDRALHPVIHVSKLLQIIGYICIFNSGRRGRGL